MKKETIYLHVCNHFDIKPLQGLRAANVVFVPSIYVDSIVQFIFHTVIMLSNHRNLLYHLYRKKETQRRDAAPRNCEPRKLWPPIPIDFLFWITCCGNTLNNNNVVWVSCVATQVLCCSRRDAWMFYGSLWTYPICILLCDNVSRWLQPSWGKPQRTWYTEYLTYNLIRFTIGATWVGLRPIMH